MTATVVFTEFYSPELCPEFFLDWILLPQIVLYECVNVVNHLTVI